MEFIDYFNYAIFILFILAYAYQMFYVAVVLVSKKREFTADKLHKFAVIIAARNERTVIGDLIASVKRQNYPQDLLDVFVVADNCTDDTAQVARSAGAIVYERFNTQFVGKGFALDFIFNVIESSHKDAHYDGYFIFDADNILDENYVAEMNKVFDSGYRVVTSYRNSKNYDSNWISAGYALWFLRESKYLNNARMLLHTSCAVSGTGFLVHSDIIRQHQGWKYSLLTEDIEFSVDSVINGEVIGYCGDAIIYDEQPCTFEQSWKQRLRWCKGFYQVFARYGSSLCKAGVTKKNFSCYDMFMTIAPALFVSLASIGVNLFFLIMGLLDVDMMGEVVEKTMSALAASFFNFYLVLFGLGIITTITEWKQIHCSTARKWLYTVTFPIFIFTYIPISIVALFKKVNWVPIKHGVTKSGVEEIQE